MAFVTSVVEHWLEWEIAQWDPTTHRTMSERSYHGATSLSQLSLNVHIKPNWIDLGFYVLYADIAQFLPQ